MKLKEARKNLSDAQERGREAAKSAADSAKAQLEPLSDAARRGAEKARAASAATRERVEGMSRSQKGAALLAASAAASAAAWWLFRRGSAAKEASQLRLEPTTNGRWRVVSEDFELEELTSDEKVFETKSEGLRVARSLARDLAAKEEQSELVVHLADGGIQDRHRYTA